MDILLCEINGKNAYKKGKDGFCYTFNKNERFFSKKRKLAFIYKTFTWTIQLSSLPAVPSRPSYLQCLISKLSPLGVMNAPIAFFFIQSLGQLLSVRRSGSLCSFVAFKFLKTKDNSGFSLLGLKVVPSFWQNPVPIKSGITFTC